MRKDPTEFRKRFAKWKETGEYELPRFGDGEERVDWKRWDDAQLTSYSIPFIKEKKVKLTNAGRATGAVLSTNLLDSIADNADRAGLPLETALGIAVKESTLGNPTDDRSAWKLSSGIRKQFNDVYPGTSQYINPGRSLNAREDVINYHKGHLSDDPNSNGKSVLLEAFEFYGKHPDKYNTGLKGYLDAVNKRGSEVMLSPEILTWKAIRDSKKAYQNSRWVRPNPALNKSRFNLPQFEGGEEKFKLKKTPEFVQAGKDNSWSKVTNNNMGATFQDLVVRPNHTGGNTSAGNWKRQWEPKQEKGLEIVSPEFDVISGVRGIMNTLPKKLSTDITFNEAKKLSDDLWDDLYRAAIKNKDTAKIQNLRDLHFKVKTPKNKAVDASGNPIKQYHTVGDKYDPNFNTFKKDIEGFDSNIYTTDNKYMSGTYSSRLLSKDELEHIIESTRKMELSSLQRYYDPKPDYIKNLISIYSSPKKARKLILKNHKWLNGQIESNRQKQLYSYLKNPVILDAEGRDWAHLPINNLTDDVFKNIKIDIRGGIGDWYSTRSVEAAINNLDYDGAIIKNVLDYGGSKRYFGPEIMNNPGTVFSIKNPKAVKLADPITYDDFGNIIPLSKRDNFNIADIRYAITPALGASALYKYAE